MILTIFISYGFKENIIEKVRGFSSDFQIINYDANRSFDFSPVTLPLSSKNKIKEIDGVSSVTGFITKPSILKFNTNIKGVVLKSYSNNNGYSFIKKNIIEGKIPDTDNNEILISEEIAKQLQLKVGNKTLLYFIQEPIRYRKLKISGIFKTDIFEFDNVFAIVDINLLQKINSWESQQVSGYEVSIIDDSKSIEIQDKIDNVIRPRYFNNNKSEQILKALNTKERFPQFYFWFNLFDTNVIVILSLMIAVAIINLVSALLIVIIENTNKVGLLKSFGAENSTIRRIFLYISAYLAIRGILWGNIIALSLAYIQHIFHIIPLDAQNYYISFVPIGFDWQSLLALNVASLLLITISLLIPSNYISKISPIKVIRFN
jgi:lipoprotein-releasing system permease protein